MTIIGELAVLITGRTQKFDRSMKKSTQIADRFGRSMKRMLVGAGIVGGVGFGIKLAMEAEKAKVAFEVLLKSAEKATETMKELREFSAKTPFQFADVQKAGKSLLAAQIPAKQLTKTLGMLGDISAITGINLSEMASIFGKMKSGNLIQGEELNQLADRGLPIFQELAKVLGTSADKIRKLGSEGKITFDHLSQAFTNLTSQGGLFFGATAKIADTAAGKWSTLKDAFSEGLRTIGDAFINGLDIKSFIDDLTSIAVTFSRDVVPAIAAGITKLVALAKSAQELALNLVSKEKKTGPLRPFGIEDMNIRGIRKRVKGIEREFHRQDSRQRALGFEAGEGVLDRPGFAARAGGGMGGGGFGKLAHPMAFRGEKRNGFGVGSGKAFSRGINDFMSGGVRGVTGGISNMADQFARGLAAITPKAKQQEVGFGSNSAILAGTGSGQRLREQAMLQSQQQEAQQTRVATLGTLKSILEVMQVKKMAANASEGLILPPTNDTTGVL